jgi:type IX secretion system substrate protein
MRRVPRCRGPGHDWACAAVLTAFALSSGAAPLGAQVVDQNLWGVNGAVTAIALSGNTLYVGGAFSQVGPNSGGGVPLNLGRGAPVAGFPKVTGYVFAAVSDGAGGWFIGGDFTSVGGVARSHLAHILADGQVGAWAPDPDGRVHALALARGTLYVGGVFNAIAGQARSKAAAVDAASGLATAWDPSASEILFGYEAVFALAVQGDTVFVGGNFRRIGGQARSYLAAVDVDIGAALDWNPSPDNRVQALALSGNTVYVGGYFTRIAGQARNLVAGFDLASGAVMGWDPRVAGARRPYYEEQLNVKTLLARENTVYIGGLIDSVGGQLRAGAGAVDAATWALVGWNPDLTAAWSYAYVHGLAAKGDTIYLGGSFSAIQGQARSFLAGVDAETGSATAWDPRPNSAVWVLAPSGNRIYAGGTYTSLGAWQVRHNLAAFDLTTGLPKDWNPDPNGPIVDALAVKDGLVYAGGEFTSIGGQPRSGIAALDTLTGVATTWNAYSGGGLNGVGAVGAILPSGNTVYVGGQFTRIGGQSRQYIAALDTNTGLATNWDPIADDAVVALALSGNTIYAAGFFHRMGGLDRTAGLAAIDAQTGTVRSWRVDGTGWTEALLVSGNTLFVGGKFDTIAGVPRRSLAAIDATSGAVKEWNPNPYGYPYENIYALAMRGHTVYVGGDFYSIGGQYWTALGAVDDSIGAATDEIPHVDNVVWSLYLTESTLYAGGIFHTVDGLPVTGVAAISIADSMAPSPLSSTLAQSTPNPAQATATIRFSLAAAGPVTLAVYDIQGRRVATIIDREMKPAGTHHVLVDADRWKSGAYFYRLDAAGITATRKMLVVR